MIKFGEPEKKAFHKKLFSTPDIRLKSSKNFDFNQSLEFHVSFRMWAYLYGRQYANFDPRQNGNMGKNNLFINLLIQCLFPT